MIAIIVDSATGVVVNRVECTDDADLSELAPEGYEAVTGEPQPGEVWDGGAFVPGKDDKVDYAYLAQKAAAKLAAEKDAAQEELLIKLDAKGATIFEMQEGLAELIRFAKQFRCWTATTDPMVLAARIKTLMEQL